MRKRNIRRSLRSRVQQLEAELRADEEPSLRLGFISRELPKDYIGERHLAVVRPMSRDSYNRQWFELEELPGPAPQGSAEKLPQVCLNETQMRICFADFVWDGGSSHPRSDYDEKAIRAHK